MFEPGGGEEFGQRLQGSVMIIVDPLDLVRHHQGASPGWILRGHAGRAPIGMAGERLDAAQRSAVTSCDVTPFAARLANYGNLPANNPSRRNEYPTPTI